MNRTILVIVVFLLILSHVAVAQPKWTFSDYDPERGLGASIPTRNDSAFYRSVAKPVREGPQHKSNAGTWELERDRRLNVAYPRIVRLSTGRSTVAVNEALTEMHGQMLRRTLEDDRILAWNMPASGGVPGASVHQWALKVTYFSTTHLSVVELVNREIGPSAFPQGNGIMIDVFSGAISGIKTCNSGLKRPTFTFGTLLSICTEAKLVAFFDLWERAALKLKDEVPREAVHNDNEVCRDRPIGHVRSTGAISLYLTETGLAVHNELHVGAIEEGCVDDPDNPFNPVIIAYRDLAPLMTPGPLRDELLALH